jgi:hypothetical protein
VAFLVNQYELDNNITTDRSPTEEYYQLMAEDILRERKRVGGDWVIAQAVARRVDRDVFRRVLGEDLMFVVLDISLDLVKERLAGRGKGEEELANVHYKYEPAGEDEPNTVGFEIRREASKDENARAVLDLINSQSNSG